METRKPASHYAFYKPANHFQIVEEKKDRYIKVKKKLKPGASEERNSAIWYKIKTKSIKEECRHEVNQINVATGELLRVLDVNQTKYRIWQEEKEEFPVSKEINGSESYQERSEREKLYYFEGMGRGLTSKLFVLDGDVSPENIVIDDQGYCYVIDNDRAFTAITLPMHIDQPADCAFSQSQEDYDTLPVSLGSFHKQKLQWDLNHDEKKSKNIAKTLSTYSRFLNEKHFQTFKILLTGHLQSAVLHQHENKSATMQKVISLNASQRVLFTQFAKGSEKCKKYIQTHRQTAICVILFEINRFFKLNKHYVEAFGKPVKALFEEESAFILKDCDSLLKELGEPSLSDKELAECNHFIANVDANVSYQFVKRFYLEQGWILQALFLDKDRLEKDFETYFLHEIPVTKFIRELLNKYDPCAVDPLQYFLKYALKHHLKRLPELLTMLTNKTHAADFFDTLLPAQQKLLGEYLFLVDQERAREFLKIPSTEPILQWLISDENPNLDVIKELCKEDKECRDSLSSLDIESFVENTNLLSYFMYTPDLFDQFTAKQMAQLFLRINFDIELGITVFLRGCHELKGSEGTRRICNLLRVTNDADDIINAMNKLIAAERAKPYFYSQFQFFKLEAVFSDELCEIIFHAKTKLEVLAIHDPTLKEKQNYKEFLSMCENENINEDMLKIDSRPSSPSA